jgi:peroxiredoxin
MISGWRWGRREIVTGAICLVAVLAIGWVFTQNNRPGNEKKTGSIIIGATAPTIEATNTDGTLVKLSDYRGKTVLLNFWASWCGPCVREMPLIHEIYQSHDPGIEILSVNVGESKGSVNEFMNEHHLTFPVIIDVTGKSADLYGVIGLPASFIIDEEGLLQQVGIGEMTDEGQIYSLLKSY